MEINWMGSREKRAQLLLLAIATGVFFLFIYFFVNASSDVKAGVIAFSAAVIATLFSHRQTKKREIDARHFEEKRTAYLKFVEIMFETFKDAKIDDDKKAKRIERKKEKSEQQLLSAMIDFTKGLVVGGDPEMVKAWIEFSSYADENSDEPGGMMLATEKLLRAIRKDLGHDDSLLPAGQLLMLILDTDGKRTIRELLLE